MKSSDNENIQSQAPEPPMPKSEFLDFHVPLDSSVAEVVDSSSVYDEDGFVSDGLPVPGYPALRYMPFGSADDLPFHMIRTIGSDEVLSQNLFFNILTTYGSGLQYVDRGTKAPSDDPDIRRFLMANSFHEFFLEQCTDMKYFFFAVAVLILDRAGKRIL